MPIVGWVTIGVATAGIIFQVVWWLVQRRVTRIDLLEQAVFGDNGMRLSMQKLVSHDALTKRLEDFRAQLLGVSEEGQLREERILAAIKLNAEQVGSQMKELREDVRAQTKRIDNLNFRSGGVVDR